MDRDEFDLRVERPDLWSEFERWMLVDGGMSDSTVYQKRCYLEYAICNGFDLDAFLEGEESGEEAARDFLAWTARSKPATAHNQYVKLVNNLVDFRGYGFRFEKRSEPANKPHAFEEHELEKLRSWEHSNPIVHRRNRALLRFALKTGMRKSEIAAVRTSDLNPEASQIYVREPAKEGFDRWIPVEPGVWRRTHPVGCWLRNHPRTPDPEAVDGEPGRDRLTRMLEEAGEVPLWVSSKPPHEAVSLNYVYQILFRMGKDVGVRANFNRTRHTRATELLQAGLDTRHIQVYLGHSKITSTQVYAEANPQSLKQAVRGIKLSGFVEPQES